MKHPLECNNCGNYRYIVYQGVRIEEGKKGFGVNMPYFECKSCGQFESILPQEKFVEFKSEIMPSINDGEFFEMPLKYIFSKLDSERKFKQYSHLDFEYDSRDYYLIPGLYREWDDGYLTPVFFNKDLLIYYNNHNDYTVKLTSFSSGNIYHKGKAMFEWGFGINRNGKIFKWLGDLDRDFKPKSMKSHLKRFQASNIASDHDVVSKFYFSQNPFPVKDAFQVSDNETRLFALYNELNKQVKEKYSLVLTKIDITSLSIYYKSPIMAEREQVFSSFLSLNKYFVENLQEDSLRKVLLKNGVSKEELEKNGNKLRGLKLLSLFVAKVLNKSKSYELMTPFFVLNDLRQLHGHLSDKSFNKEYKSCKERLALDSKASYLDVSKTLVTKLILSIQNLIDKNE
jgi:hypothetical protein